MEMQRVFLAISHHNLVGAPSAMGRLLLLTISSIKILKIEPSTVKYWVLFLSYTAQVAISSSISSSVNDHSSVPIS